MKTLRRKPKNVETKTEIKQEIKEDEKEKPKRKAKRKRPKNENSGKEIENFLKSNSTVVLAR